MRGIRTQQSADRYIPLDVIGKGGMAEVFRCKLVGEQGFEKLVVLKRLLPEAARDSELVTNFIDEARLAALLQHENIAHIYNFGEFENSYFIAMEYLSGRDLHSIMLQARESQQPLGVEHALLIALKICEGMDYAHNLKDLRQRPLNIIHRDLTPHNVFVTYEGKVKIIDFGIAKAELYDHRTRVGVVKGKISYMSPEQLVGDDLDRRSDIFSISILLYEMLSGRRMYSGDTATLIRKCLAVDYQPLEEVSPGLPEMVYSILHNGLKKDRESRYQSCGEMIRDIEECLYNLKQHIHSQLLKDYILTLFKEEHEREQLRLTELRDSVTGDINIDDLEDGTLEQTILEEVTLPSHITGTLITENSEWFDISDRMNFTGRLLLIREKLISYAERAGWQVMAVGGGLFLLVVLVSVFSWNPSRTGIHDEREYAVVKANISDTGRNPELQEQIKASAREILESYVSTQEQVESLLKKGYEALEAERLTIPRDQSALSYFEQVLERDPDNNIARDGLRNIGEEYANLAEKSLAGGNLSGAADYLNKGLAVSPDNGRLLNLQEQVSGRQQEQVQILSSRAREAIRQNKLTTPYSKSAFRFYKELMKLDGGRQEAEKVLRKIGDRYAILGENAYRSLQISEARSYVRKGLKVVPDNERLLALKKELGGSEPEVFFRGLEKKLNALFQ